MPTRSKPSAPVASDATPPTAPFRLVPTGKFVLQFEVMVEGHGPSIIELSGTDHEVILDLVRVATAGPFHTVGVQSASEARALKAKFRALPAPEAEPAGAPRRRRRSAKMRAGRHGT